MKRCCTSGNSFVDLRQEVRVSDGGCWKRTENSFCFFASGICILKQGNQVSLRPCGPGAFVPVVWACPRKGSSAITASEFLSRHVPQRG